MSEENGAPEPQTTQEEVIDYKDKYFRLLAEMENSRKRMQKEKLEATRYAIDNLLAEIIAPMDNFQNALQFTENQPPEVKNWAMGFQMILGQFKEVLEQNGVTPFKSEGEMFDPFKHEAIESEENDDLPEGTIVKEYVRGYRAGDRIVRPARVKVTVHKEIKQGETNE